MQVVFPGFNHVYLLQDPLSMSAYRGLFDSSIDPLAVTRGEITPETPIPIQWDTGGESPSDVIWTTAAHPVIVHQRVLDLLSEKNLTGWRSYPVQVIDKSGVTHADYAGLQFYVGRCGVVDLSRSSVTLKRYPGGWFPNLVGVLRQAQIRNVAYERLTDVSVSVSTYKISQADLLPPGLQERINAAYEQQGLPRP